MIRVVEVIPLDRFADGVDVGQSVLRYADEVTRALCDRWIDPAGVGPVITDAVRVVVMVGQPGTRWMIDACAVTQDGADVPIDDVDVLGDYQLVSAWVWVWRPWAVIGAAQVQA